MTLKAPGPRASCSSLSWSARCYIEGACWAIANAVARQRRRGGITTPAAFSMQSTLLRRGVAGVVVPPVLSFFLPWNDCANAALEMQGGPCRPFGTRCWNFGGYPKCIVGFGLLVCFIWGSSVVPIILILGIIVQMQQ